MKKCIKHNCTYPQFGGGYCKGHQYLRTDKRKRINRVKKTTGIPKHNFDMYQWGFSGEKEMFDHIWSERPKTCVVSGENLNRYEGTDFYVNMFSHILSKAQNKFPLYKYNPNNIALVDPYVHHLIDHGSQEQRLAVFEKERWDEYYDKKGELLGEYKRII